jgi:hypothetical protein
MVIGNFENYASYLRALGVHRAYRIVGINIFILPTAIISEFCATGAVSVSMLASGTAGG